MAPVNRLIDVASGTIVLGKGDPHHDACTDGDARRYGWDNEYGRHEADVPAFKASQHLVSNAEFLAFD